MDGAMEEIGASAAAGDTLHDAQREIRQLRETITALRDELEAQAHEKERAVQEAAATADHEIHQLRQTATVLREELVHRHRRMIHPTRLQEIENICKFPIFVNVPTESVH